MIYPRKIMKCLMELAAPGSQRIMGALGKPAGTWPLRKNPFAQTNHIFLLREEMLKSRRDPSSPGRHVLVRRRRGSLKKRRQFPQAGSFVLPPP